MLADLLDGWSEEGVRLGGVRGHASKSVSVGPSKPDSEQGQTRRLGCCCRCDGSGVAARRCLHPVSEDKHHAMITSIVALKHLQPLLNSRRDAGLSGRRGGVVERRLRARVRVQVYARVRVQVYARVRVHVYARVRVHVYARVRVRAYARVRVHVYARVRVRVPLGAHERVSASAPV